MSKKYMNGVKIFAQENSTYESFAEELAEWLNSDKTKSCESMTINQVCDNKGRLIITFTYLYKIKK